MGMIQTKYTANTGCVTISSGTSSLDGSSTTTVLTAGANGTFIRNVIVKAQTNTSEGMLRFYVNDGVGNAKLIQEVYVPAITKSSRDCSYFRILPFNFTIASGDTFSVTSEIADTFNIIAEGLDWSYASTYSELSTIFTGNSGIGKIETANNNLNGTGACPTILTAVSSGSGNGTLLDSIIIKAQQNVTPGMVRIYIKNSNGTYLMTEVLIPYFNYSATSKSFIFKSPFTFALQSDFEICASTENGETFSVIIDGYNWSYLNN